jgi:AcrR family transcriptional regulator
MARSKHVSRKSRRQDAGLRRPTSSAPRARVRDPEAARDAIISSGKVVFNREGYFRTNSNVIAQRSGYAASSFYTHFRDKLDLFLVVYRTWVDGEWSGVRAAVDVTIEASEFFREAVERLIEHHRRWRTFRANLRALAALEPRMREAQNRQRRHQIEWLKDLAEKLAWPPPSTSKCTFVVLALERVFDAIAEGDVVELGVDSKELKQTVVSMLEHLLVPTAKRIEPCS